MRPVQRLIAYLSNPCPAVRLGPYTRCSDMRVATPLRVTVMRHQWWRTLKDRQAQLASQPSSGAAGVDHILRIETAMIGVNADDSIDLSQHPSRPARLPDLHANGDGLSQQRSVQMRPFNVKTTPFIAIIATKSLKARRAVPMQPMTVEAYRRAIA